MQYSPSLIINSFISAGILSSFRGDVIVYREASKGSPEGWYSENRYDFGCEIARHMAVNDELAEEIRDSYDNLCLEEYWCIPANTLSVFLERWIEDFRKTAIVNLNSELKELFCSGVKNVASRINNASTSPNMLHFRNLLTEELKNAETPEDALKLNGLAKHLILDFAKKAIKNGQNSIIIGSNGIRECAVCGSPLPYSVAENSIEYWPSKFCSQCANPLDIPYNAANCEICANYYACGHQHGATCKDYINICAKRIADEYKDEEKR